MVMLSVADGGDDDEDRNDDGVGDGGGVNDGKHNYVEDHVGCSVCEDCCGDVVLMMVVF